jgi:hypothetical protein
VHSEKWGILAEQCMAVKCKADYCKADYRPNAHTAISPSTRSAVRFLEPNAAELKRQGEISI